MPGISHAVPSSSTNQDSKNACYAYNAYPSQYPAMSPLPEIPVSGLESLSGNDDQADAAISKRALRKANKKVQLKSIPDEPNSKLDADADADADADDADTDLLLPINTSLNATSVSSSSTTRDRARQVRRDPAAGLDLRAIDAALEQDIMNLNAGNGAPYQSYIDGGVVTASVGGHTSGFNGGGAGAGGMQQRQAPSPQVGASSNGSVAGGNGAAGSAGAGGMNGMGIGMPMNAGQQMDVNLIYQKLMELGNVLQENRERTNGIVASAEELSVRAAAHGASPSIQEANQEITAGRIADLTLALSREKTKTRILMREQRENTRLISDYETGLGSIVEMVRNFAYNVNGEKTSISRHYNKLLQDEKDAHLAARLEKDEWFTKAMRYGEMIRTAYRLRCEETDPYIRVVNSLQEEVRGYRAAMGIEPEKFEDEAGYEVLRDVKNGAGEPRD